MRNSSLSRAGFGLDCLRPMRKYMYFGNRVLMTGSTIAIFVSIEKTNPTRRNFYTPSNHSTRRCNMIRQVFRRVEHHRAGIRHVV